MSKTKARKLETIENMDEVVFDQSLSVLGKERAHLIAEPYEILLIKQVKAIVEKKDISANVMINQLVKELGNTAEDIQVAMFKAASEKFNNDKEADERKQKQATQN